MTPTHYLNTIHMHVIICELSPSYIVIPHHQRLYPWVTWCACCCFTSSSPVPSSFTSWLVSSYTTEWQASSRATAFTVRGGKDYYVDRRWSRVTNTRSSLIIIVIRNDVRQGPSKVYEMKNYMAHHLQFNVGYLQPTTHHIVAQLNY